MFFCMCLLLSLYHCPPIMNLLTFATFCFVNNEFSINKNKNKILVNECSRTCDVESASENCKERSSRNFDIIGSRIGLSHRTRCMFLSATLQSIRLQESRAIARDSSTSIGLLAPALCKNVWHLSHLWLIAGLNQQRHSTIQTIPSTPTVHHLLVNSTLKTYMRIS